MYSEFRIQGPFELSGYITIVKLQPGNGDDDERVKVLWQ